MSDSHANFWVVLCVETGKNQVVQVNLAKPPSSTVNPSFFFFFFLGWEMNNCMMDNKCQSWIFILFCNNQVEKFSSHKQQWTR